jgi:ABC-type uncharacterized transport system involved in gliding motility auxiliary subunit
VRHAPSATRALDGENLVLTGEAGFGIDDRRRTPSQFDKSRDLHALLSIATAINEPVNFNSAEGRKEPARLVVVGDTDFATNSWFDKVGNADFAVNCVDWMARREELISLRAQPPETRVITLTVGGRTALWWLILGLLPGFAAALGGIVAWQRRA